jgi:group I intron endonuclease
MVGIYKIINPRGKMYIGKSKNIEKRFTDYRKIQCCKQQRKIYHSLKKYGPENHIFEIIEECEYEMLNDREIYWISKFNSIIEGLNLTSGGDGGVLSEESQKLRRLNSSNPIYQFTIDGVFIKRHNGATFAVEELGKGNANNINDCARGKYKVTYGYRWVYEKDIQDLTNLHLPPVEYLPNGAKWTEDRRIRTSKSREGETRSIEYKQKISQIKRKPIYRTDINGNTTQILNSFSDANGSKIIGTKKLRSIINKNITYKGYIYHYNI